MILTILEHLHVLFACLCSDDLHIPVVWNMLATHAPKMRGLKLAVDQLAASVLHHVGKINQGKLGSGGC